MIDYSKQSKRPDHQSVRRFSLTLGLVLLSYSIAGISLRPDTEINVLGLPFQINHPQLLPYVLLATTVYGALRYYFYCILLAKTPYSIRRETLDRLVHHIRMEDGLQVTQLRSFGVYLGPTNFELGPKSPWMYKRDRKAGEGEPPREEPGAWSVTIDSSGIPVMPEEGVSFQREIQSLFPTFAGAQVWSRWNYESSEPPMRVRLYVVIPNRCRLAAIFEDLDYTAPVWLSLAAILTFIWSHL